MRKRRCCWMSAIRFAGACSRMATTATMRKPKLLALALALIGAARLGAETLTWPHPIPCRTQDGVNPDIWVMTLGDPQTSLADGVFDPVADAVTMRDGSVKTN